MADKLFDVHKLKSFIDKFFKSFSQFIDGYEVKESDIKAKSGQVTNSLDLAPTREIPYNMHIELSATNIGKIFKDELKFIDSLSVNGIKSDARVRNHLKDLTGIALLPSGENGISYDEEGDLYQRFNEISVKSIEARQAGLLGTPLDNTTTLDNLGPWKDIAFNKLIYSLLCRADALDTGEIENQNLTDCVRWISKYIEYVSGSIEKDKQLSHKEKIKLADNINNTALILVIPILKTIQDQLKERYQDKLNSDLALDEFIKQPKAETENSESKESEEANEEMKNTPAESSKHINFTLKKIQASNELEILSLDSNYLPGDTLDDIDNIINQEEFLSELTEEPQTFAISVDDEGFDIAPCEECEIDPCASLNSVMNTAIIMYRNLYVLHWMAKGNDMMKLHLLTEELYSELIQEIDTLGELLVEKCGTVQNLDFEWTPIAVRNYEFQESLVILKDFIQNYIDTIDYAYPNQTSDVQSTLDDWLRYWNKQMNYFIKNQEEQ